MALIYKPTICVSINAFLWEGPNDNCEFLKGQLDNIRYALAPIFNYKIVLNCSNQLYDLVGSDYVDDENIYIHPSPLDKRRMHGSILHGIHRNMEFSQQWVYDHFLVLSARTVFVRKPSIEQIVDPVNIFPGKDPEKMFTKLGGGFPT